jgi:hypothetical protein
LYLFWFFKNGVPSVNEVLMWRIGVFLAPPCPIHSCIAPPAAEADADADIIDALRLYSISTLSTMCALSYYWPPQFSCTMAIAVQCSQLLLLVLLG